jgi:hypothetical protein
MSFNADNGYITFKNLLPCGHCCWYRPDGKHKENPTGVSPAAECTTSSFLIDKDTGLVGFRRVPDIEKSGC